MRGEAIMDGQSTSGLEHGEHPFIACTTMNASIFVAAPRKVISIKVVLYSLPCGSHSEIYIDRRAAIELARTIDGLHPRGPAVELLYLTFAYEARQQHNAVSSDQALLDCLSPVMMQLVVTETGRELYRVMIEQTLQYTERAILEWEVTYQRGDEWDEICHDIERYVSSYTQPVLSILQATPFCEENSFTQVSGLESGFTTPQERSPLLQELDSLMQSLDRHETTLSKSSTHKPRKQFPISHFTLANTQREIDGKAAQTILHTVKVLVVSTKAGAKHRWSLSCELDAMRSMSIDASLNVGSQERTKIELLRRLFDRYDGTDEEGRESFQRGMLMVVVRLLRHKHLYHSGPKTPGNYAADFDKLFPFPSGYMRVGHHLCRIIVACGHPAVLVVLVRLAIRNRLSLAALLTAIPIPQFCRWLASGRVRDDGVDDTQPHRDLLWLHTNAFLPLLHAASLRVPARLYLVDGSLTCDDEACLTAIVHSTKQIRYAQFLLGTHTDPEWERGKVLVESRVEQDSVVAEFSVERKARTFQRYGLACYANDVEHFDNPPRFLKSQTLALD